MLWKIIALAVAGLVSGAAFAQSNVTVYGVVDIGYQSQSSHTKAGTNSLRGLNDGLQSGSRIGFRGTEDLGGGLKASFVLEQEIINDVQNTAGMFGGTNRQSYLALSGNFGTAAFGHQYTPQFLMDAKLDPFGRGLSGSQARIKRDINNRVSNLAAYISPNFNGFNVIAGYTMNATADEKVVNGGNNKTWAINPNYSAGPLYVGLNIHQVKADTAGANNVADKAMDLGASYDLGMVKLAGEYSTRKQANVDNRRYYMLGATIRVSAVGNVLLSYNNGRDKLAANTKERQTAIGYTHAMSKRTNVYTSLAKRGQNYAGYKTEFDVGLRHSF